METEGTEIVSKPREDVYVSEDEDSKDCDNEIVVEENCQSENENSGETEPDDAVRNETDNVNEKSGNSISGNSEGSSEYCDSENVEICTPNNRMNIQKEISPEGKWVIRTYTGFIVTLNMLPDRDRPDNFGTERARMMWDTATNINLNRLKHQIQTGEYIPDHATVEVDPNPLKAPARMGNYSARLESEELRSEKVAERCNKKVSILEQELELVGLALNIRECFTGEHQLEEGLTLMEKVSRLQITPLMLKKNPFVVNTIHCLCNYAGMKGQLEINNTPGIQEVKTKAKELYEKLQSVFSVSDKSLFEECFGRQKKLLWKMFQYNVHRTCELVNDPTLKF